MRTRRRSWGGCLLVTGLAAVFLSGGSASAVAGADEVADGRLTFVAKVSFGAARSCTGALIDTQWIVTAKDCFADGATRVAAGAPTRPTTVLLGRADLDTVTGRRLTVTTLVPHPDRNVVLARLSAPAVGITPARVATSAPRADETVRIAGYGRTATEWVPNRLHAGVFTVRSASTAAFEVEGAGSGATLCRGDAGGPAFRETGDGVDLVGITDRSWQKGCLGEPPTESRAQGYEARVDDLAGWIRASISVQPTDLREVVAGDFNRDGSADLIGVDTIGTGWLYPSTSAHTWGLPVRLSTTWGTYRELTVGRVDRDDYDDLVAVSDSGQLLLWTGTANALGLTGRGAVNTGFTGYRDLTIGRLNGDTYDTLYAIESSTNAWFKFAGTAAGGSFSTSRVQTGGGWGCCRQNTFGRFNDDAYLDLVTIESTGKLRLYPGTAGGALGASVAIDGAGTAWGGASQLTAGRFDDSGLTSLIEVEASTGRLYLHRRTADGGWPAREALPGTALPRQPSDLVRMAGGEFTRDAYPDLIGADAAGNGWLFPGTAVGTWGRPSRLSSTWSGYREFTVGRVDRDNYDDVVVLTDSGQLLLYTGSAAGGVAGKGQIGTGYGGYRDLAIGRLKGDTYDSLYAVESSTNAWFRFAGTAAGGSFSTTRVQAGGGWGCCRQNTFGRFNDDAYLDLLSLESTGRLRLYPGQADGSLGTATAVDVAGTGWGNRELAAARDARTGRDGVVAKDPTSGALLLHPSDPFGSVQWTDPIAYGPR